MSKKRANRSAAFQNTPEIPNKAGDAGTGYADTQSVNKEDGADEGFRKRDTYYRNDAKVHSGRQKAGREFSRKGTFDAEVREEAGIGRMSRKEQKASGNNCVFDVYNNAAFLLECQGGRSFIRAANFG